MKDVLQKEERTREKLRRKSFGKRRTDGKTWLLDDV
jgi:hypothetical protein